MPLATVALHKPTGTVNRSTTSIPGSPTYQFKPVTSTKGFNAAPHQQVASGIKPDALNASHHQQFASNLRPHFNASLHQQEFTPEPIPPASSSPEEYLPKLSASFKKTAKRASSTSTRTGSEHQSESYAPLAAGSKPRKSGAGTALMAAPQTAGDMDAATTPEVVGSGEPPAKKAWFCC